MSDNISPDAFRWKNHEEDLNWQYYSHRPHQARLQGKEEPLFAESTIREVIEQEQGRHGMGTDAWTALEMVLRELSKEEFKQKNGDSE